MIYYQGVDMEKRQKSRNLVLGVIGEDVHVVGIRILEYALRDAGFNIVSLGAQVSQQEFINAAIETDADAILVSSFSGHAEHLASGFKEKCIEVGLEDILLLIGGQLSIQERPWNEVEKIFKNLGFDGVYPPGTTSTTVVDALEKKFASS
jgi:methylaspartate mutase sigma subunit